MAATRQVTKTTQIAGGGTGSVTCTLPTPKPAGAKCVIIVAIESGAGPASCPGWTQKLTNTQSDLDFTVLERTLDGSEGATVLVSWGAGSDIGIVHIYIHENAGAITYGTIAVGNSTIPNALSVSAAGGAGDNLFVTIAALASFAADPHQTRSATPAGYSEVQDSINTVDANAQAMSTAIKVSAAAADDAADWTFSPGEQWSAVTYVVEAGVIPEIPAEYGGGLVVGSPDAFIGEAYVGAYPTLPLGQIGDGLVIGSPTSHIGFSYVGAAETIVPSGIGAATLPSLTASGAGVQIYTGTVAVTLPSLTAQATDITAVAHDNSTEFATFTTTSPAEVEHTPVAAAAGILLFIDHGTNADDLILGAAYGGFEMIRVRSAVDVATELGRTYIYALGQNVPAGAQTVSIRHTATAVVKHAVVVSVTAGGDIEIVASGVLQADQANPQIALDSGAVMALRYAVIYSGLAAPSDLTNVANMTAVQDHDFGNFVSRVDRQTDASSGSFTIGWTGASDDVAMAAVAVRQVETGFPVILSITKTIFPTGVQNHPIAQDPTHVDAGDLLVQILLYNPVGDQTGPTAPAEHTEIFDEVAGNDAGMYIAAKIADGDEAGTTVDIITLGGSLIAEATGYSVRIKAGTHYGITDGIAVVASAVVGAGANPDSPSLNPAAWAIEKTLWAAMAVMNSDTALVPTMPAGYVLAQYSDVTSQNSENATTVLVFKKSEAASEDPGAFTFDATTDYMAQTLAIRPASSTPTGIGAAILPSLTASGTAVHQQTGTGAATLPGLNAAATGVMQPSGVGAATLPSMTASGTAVHQQTATGAATLPSLTATGTAAQVYTATGAPSLPSLTADATGVMQPSGVGACTLPSLTANGTAIHEQTATGAATLPSLTAAVTAVQTITGTAAATLPSLTSSGNAVLSTNATGAVTLPSLTADATGTQTQTATGAATLPSLTASGTAVHEQTATGAVTLPSLTANATGVMQPSGTAAVTLPSLTASGTAVHEQTSTGSATLPSLVASGTAEHSHSGTGTPTLPSLTAAATGYMEPSGTAAVTLPSLTASGTAVHEQTATGAVTLPSLTASGSGISTFDVSATGAATLPSLTASATGIHEQTATGAATLPSLTCAATGVMQPSGTAAATLPSLTSNATGIHEQTATGTATLPSLTADSTAIHEQTATGAVTLPSLTCSGTGTSLAEASGTGAATLPSLTAAASGYMEPSGVGAATLPSLTCAADGLHIQAVTGTAVCTLPSLTCSGSGTQTVTGTAACTLPSLTCSGTAVLAQTGTAVCTLPSLTCSGTALVVITGTVIVTLPSLVTTSTGIVIITNILGTVAVTLPSLSSSGAAVIILNVIIQAILEGCIDLDDLIERRRWIDNVLASGYAKGIDVPIPSGFIEPRETVVPSGYIKIPGSGNLWDM